MTTERRQVIRLVLADIAVESAQVNLARATPLGTSAAIGDRLKTILPGATFDGVNSVVFARTAYTIRFSFAAPDPATVDVELDGLDGVAALKRVVDKTGWRAVDSDSLRLVDLEATRSTGAMVLVSGATTREDASTGARRGASIVKRAIQVAAVVGFSASWWWITSAAPSGGESMRGNQGYVDPSRAQTFSDRLVRGIAEVRSRKVAYTKAVAPGFRSNPAVAQLFEFGLAEWRYSSEFGMGRYAKPERLSDQEFWARFQMPARLPATFANPERSGYRFEFTGDECGPMKGNLSAPQDDCDGFAYRASPIDDPKLPKGRLSFALLTSDGRIHYCSQDPCVPSATDPTVDNTDPSSHDDLINAGEPAPTGVIAVVLHSLTAMIERIMGDKPGSTAVNAAEGNAIKELRELAHAERVFDAMMNGLDRFARPQALADPAMFSRVKMAPLLPGYFAQPVRFGYEFDFSGQTVAASSGGVEWITPQYDSYVYSARPAKDGPPGRRSFAVFPDGAVYATSDARVPTRRDTPLGTQ